MIATHHKSTCLKCGTVVEPKSIRMFDDRTIPWKIVAYQTTVYHKLDQCFTCKLEMGLRTVNFVRFPLK